MTLSIKKIKYRKISSADQRQPWPELRSPYGLPPFRPRLALIGTPGENTLKAFLAVCLFYDNFHYRPTIRVGEV